MNQLVLSLFPGIDGLGMGFHQEGFSITWGPDRWWGWDVRELHLPAGRFDGLIGGPPCKGESNLAHLNGTPGMTMRGEFKRLLDEAQPAWWVMEAVKPHEDMDCYILPLTPRWLGGEQSRKRFFHSNLNMGKYVELEIFEPAEFRHAVLAGHGGERGQVVRGMASYRWDEMLRLQDFPPDYDLPGFTVQAKREAVGNAVPVRMARAVARAVKRALEATR